MQVICSHSRNDIYTVLLGDPYGYFMIRTVRFTGWQGKPVVAESTFDDKADAERYYNKLTAV
jgi:hypothetical protein